MQEIESFFPQPLSIAELNNHRKTGQFSPEKIQILQVGTGIFKSPRKLGENTTKFSSNDERFQRLYKTLKDLRCFLKIAGKLMSHRLMGFYTKEKISRGLPLQPGNRPLSRHLIICKIQFHL